MVFPPTRFLQNMLIEVSYGHNFFYRHKEKGQADLPGTLNMVVNPAENFLEGFEKKVSAQNMRFYQNILPGFELHFSKSQLLSLFLTYNQIGVSYGYDFFTDTNDKVKQTSQIP